MFTKIYKLFMVTAMLAFIIGIFNVNISNGQNTVTKESTVKYKTNLYPVFTLSPVAGAIFPMSELGNTYGAGFNGGLDLGVRMNRELSLYAKFGYYNLTNNTPTIPSSSYIEISAGPRYNFTDPKLKSIFFMEAGVGAYIFSQDAYTEGTQNFPEISNTNIGINVGPGVVLTLSKAVDVILKSKYHMIFNDGGTRSFITALGGLEFKF